MILLHTFLIEGRLAAYLQPLEKSAWTQILAYPATFLSRLVTVIFLPMTQ